MLTKTITIVAAFTLVFTVCKKASSPYEPGDNHSGSWELVFQSAGDIYFWDMHFTDQNNGWMVGDSGSVMHSDDQDLTWQSQESGTVSDLRSVYFIDKNTGWIAGDYNTVLKTANGGEAWLPLAFPDIVRTKLTTIYFIDEKNGYISGFIFNTNDNYSIESGGRIWHTADAGQTWTVQTAVIPWVIFSVQFFDQYEGWAITTDSGALHTTDGGNDWVSVPVPTHPDTFGMALSNMFFLNNEKGWVSGLNVGASPYPGLAIYHTSDCGVTWKAQASLRTSMINSIFFIDEKRGWAAGSDGIFCTGNGGDTWNIQHEDVYIRDIHFVTAENGWALSSRGDIFKYTY